MFGSICTVPILSMVTYLQKEELRKISINICSTNTMFVIFIIVLIVFTPRTHHTAPTPLVEQWIVFQALPMLFIDLEIFESGRDIFLKYADKKLSFCICIVSPYCSRKRYIR